MSVPSLKKQKPTSRRCVFSPVSLQVLSGDDGPQPEAPGLAIALARAVDAGRDTSPMILTALAALIREPGMRAQTEDAARIGQDGALPIVVALLARGGKSTITYLVTTIAAPVAPPFVVATPSATVH